jgi:hypothetical protein
MKGTSLAAQNYELIKQHIVDPENSRLSIPLQKQLDRLLSAAKLLDKNPIKKHAVALHRKKFPEIHLATAYRDLNEAAKLYSTYHTFDWDFWQNWILQDIIENIKQCRKTGTSQDKKIIATEHANLLKAIGEKPANLDDPNRHEKNQFFILVNLGKNSNLQIDLENLDKLPPATLQQLNKVLFSGRDIEDAEILDIMES